MAVVHGAQGTCERNKKLINGLTVSTIALQFGSAMSSTTTTSGSAILAFNFRVDFLGGDVVTTAEKYTEQNET